MSLYTQSQLIAGINPLTGQIETVAVIDGVLQTTGGSGASNNGAVTGTGDASAFNQVLQIQRLDQLLNKLPASLLNGRLLVDNSGVVQPVSITSIPLPSGAATSQDIQNLTGRLPASLVNDRLKVDGSGVTQPVSGTVAVSNLPNNQIISGIVTANIGSGSLAGIVSTVTVKADTLVNQTSPLKVDGSGYTQPVSVNNLPLATDASTATLQLTSNTLLTNLNNKLPPNLTVNNTRLLVDNSGITQPITGTVLANIGNGYLAGVTSTVTVKADTLANQTNPLKVDGSGYTQQIAGNVTLTNAAIAISNLPTTQQVSVVSLPLPTGAATSGLQSINNTTLDNLNTKIPSNITVLNNRLLVDNSGITQPITGTVLANIGSGNLAGITNTVVIKADSLVNQVNPLKVDGSWYTQQISGSVTANIGNGNLAGITNTVTIKADSLSSQLNPLRVDGSSYTQPITGVVTANINNTNGLALDNTLINGSQKTVIRSGVKGNAIASEITSTPIDSNTQALDVTIKNTANITGIVQAIQSGVWDINITGVLPLPTSAATSALQVSGNASLVNIENKLPQVINNKIPVNNSIVKQFTVETLTLPGFTSSFDVSDCSRISCFYTITNISTNVTVRLEGSADGSNWANLLDSDLIIIENKTDAFILNSVAIWRIRFRYVAYSGTNAPQITVRFLGS
jgi:hypothetical protein